MKKNMGLADKIIRLLVAVVFIALYFTKVITGAWGIVMLVIAGIFIVTSLVSICPLYSIFNMSTLKKKAVDS
ncbi:MAG TPA: DUF2892 domain-containing protein [Bacteroidales bacterium]|nr:DUF2892 domain-containing protein [Bacteroidales bacterium]